MSFSRGPVDDGHLLWNCLHPHGFVFVRILSFTNSSIWIKATGLADCCGTDGCLLYLVCMEVSLS